MEIDDILREVDPASQSIPAETRDLQALTRAWVAERSSPELLQYVHLLRPVRPNSVDSADANEVVCPRVQLARRWPLRARE